MAKFLSVDEYLDSWDYDIEEEIIPEPAVDQSLREETRATGKRSPQKEAFEPPAQQGGIPDGGITIAPQEEDLKGKRPADEGTSTPEVTVEDYDVEYSPSHYTMKDYMGIKGKEHYTPPASPVTEDPLPADIIEVREELKALQEVVADMKQKVDNNSNINLDQNAENKALLNKVIEELSDLNSRVNRLETGSSQPTSQPLPQLTSQLPQPAVSLNEIKDLITHLIGAQTAAAARSTPAKDEVQSAVDQALLDLMADGYCAKKNMKDPGLTIKYPHLKDPIKDMINWFRAYGDIRYPYKWALVDGRYVKIHSFQPELSSEILERLQETSGLKKKKTPGSGSGVIEIQDKGDPEKKRKTRD